MQQNDNVLGWSDRQLHEAVLGSHRIDLERATKQLKELRDKGPLAYLTLSKDENEKVLGRVWRGTYARVKESDWFDAEPLFEAKDDSYHTYWMRHLIEQVDGELEYRIARAEKGIKKQTETIAQLKQ